MTIDLMHAYVYSKTDAGEGDAHGQLLGWRAKCV